MLVFLMESRERNCPNLECASNNGVTKFRYIKKGTYRTKHNRQLVVRYQCSVCKKHFSANTFKYIYRQNKPFLNKEIFKMYCSGMTQRRMAKVLGCNRGTVISKFHWLASLAYKFHQKVLDSGSLDTSFVHFDEMQSFEKTKLLPLAIPLAVKWKTGEIIDAKVARIPCGGANAKVSRKKYGFRADESPEAIKDVMRVVKRVSKEKLIVASDLKNYYPTILKHTIPWAECKREKGDTTAGRNLLSKLNFTCALLRQDLSRLRRKTWITTKKIIALENHLTLYIAYHNKYKILSEKEFERIPKRVKPYNHKACEPPPENIFLEQLNKLNLRKLKI